MHHRNELNSEEPGERHRAKPLISDPNAPDRTATTPLYRRIYEVVRRIPVGRVATYGQVARWAGYPGYARQVGYALYRLLPQDSDVPWQRVINAQGRISYSPLRYGSDDHQRALLEAEGIEFDDQDRIDLKRYGLDPLDRELTDLQHLAPSVHDSKDL